MPCMLCMLWCEVPTLVMDGPWSCARLPFEGHVFCCLPVWCLQVRAGGCHPPLPGAGEQQQPSPQHLPPTGTLACIVEQISLLPSCLIPCHPAPLSCPARRWMSWARARRCELAPAWRAPSWRSLTPLAAEASSPPTCTPCWTCSSSEWPGCLLLCASPLLLPHCLRAACCQLPVASCCV